MVILKYFLAPLFVTAAYFNAFAMQDVRDINVCSLGCVSDWEMLTDGTFKINTGTYRFEKNTDNQWGVESVLGDERFVLVTDERKISALNCIYNLVKLTGGEYKSSFVKGSLKIETKNGNAILGVPGTWHVNNESIGDQGEIEALNFLYDLVRKQQSNSCCCTVLSAAALLALFVSWVSYAYA
jgi:hypothetical protein